MSPQVGGPGKVYQVPLGLATNALRHLCDRPSQGSFDVDIILNFMDEERGHKEIK